MADVTYNYIKAFNSVPRSEDPKQWFSLTITNSNPTPESTLTLRGGDYFIINYSGGQNYKYVFEVGGPTIPASDNEINVLLGANDYECFINLRNAILNTEFLITTVGGAYPLPGVIGDKYAYAGAAVFNDPTTTHHAAVSARVVGGNMEISISPYFWNELDNGSETLEVRGQIGVVAAPPFFTGTIGTTPITQGIGEVGENLSQDPTAIGERVNAFHFNTVEWKLDATAGAGGWFEVIRYVYGPFGLTTFEPVARFPANFNPGDGVTPGTDTLANFDRIPFTYESSTETYTFYDTFAIDEKPSCSGTNPEYPIFSNYNISTTTPAEYFPVSVPVMGLEFYNGINNSEIEQYAIPNEVPTEEGSVSYAVRFIDLAGTEWPTQDAVAQGEVFPAQNGNFEKFGLIRAERPTVGLVEKTCDAGGEGCDFYRTRIFLPGGLFNDTTFGGILSASNEQFLLELIGSEIYNNDISSVCDYPSDWVLDAPNIAFVREVNGVEEYIDPFAFPDNPAGNTASACRAISSNGSCAFDDVFYISRDGTECENEDGIPTLPVLCDTLDSLNYYIEATYTAIPSGAPGVPSCPADGVSVTGRVKVEPFGEIAVQTIFYDDSCFGPNPGLKAYMPCCPRLTGVTASIGDCFSEQQGDVQLSWALEYGESESPIGIEIDRPATISFDSLNVELTPGYERFETGWIDSGLILPSDCTTTETVVYNVTFSYQDPSGTTITQTESIEVVIPCCYEDCADNTETCDICWSKGDTNLKCYLEGYFEDPFQKEASFQIKYCIDDACALGISESELYLTLPVGISITRYEGTNADIEYNFEESFVGGVYPGRWRLTTARLTSDIEDLLPPTYGILGTVYFDKPLGDNLVCFEEDSNITVRVADTPGASPPTESVTPVLYESENNVSFNSTPDDEALSWQTGPCLSTCTDEVDVGFGDFNFDTNVVNNKTLDINYCLTRGSIDSFLLLCVIDDFSTGVSAIDTKFGDIVDRGWDVHFKNLCPGFALIYGKGRRPIPSAGISTLLRLYFNQDILQNNLTGEEVNVCILPLLGNIGNTYSQLEEYITFLSSQPSSLLLDSVKNSVATGSSQEGAGYILDLQEISTEIDSRFKPIVDTLLASYSFVINNYDNTNEYQNNIKANAIKTAHYFRVFYTVWTSLVNSIPNLFDKLEDSGNPVLESCDNSIGVKFECPASNPGKLYCHITYDFSLCSASGVQINLASFQSFVDEATNNVTLNDDLSWTGDASDKSYIQAYSTTYATYIACYGAQLSQKREEASQVEYLRTDSSSTNEYLTTIALNIEDYSNWGTDLAGFQSLCTFVEAAGDSETAWNTLSSLSDYDSFVALRNALKTGINRANVATNEKTFEAAPGWTGNSFTPRNSDLVDVSDFLTTIMIIASPDNFVLTEDNISSVIKLPSTTSASSIKDFYDLNTLDLTGVDYGVTGTDAFKTPTGDYILPTIDANQNGRMDITDIVSLRNVWYSSSEYPISASSEIQSRKIVPTQCCLKLDLDIEVLIPDNCSTFCFSTDCYGKVWLSDMILVRDEFERPDKYLLEVSYGINCQNDDVTNYPVQDVSGVQFKIEGLNGEGINGTILGFGERTQRDATAVKAGGWSENILSSIGSTKDTYISYSTNGKYVEKGSGVLCYLEVPVSSIPDASVYLESKISEESIFTNKFIKYESSSDVSAISDISTFKIGYPLANLRFSSYDTSELLIYERFGIRIVDYKLSSNRYYNEDTEEYINMTSAPSAGWTGDYEGLGNPELSLDYVLALAATGQYDAEFDATGDGKIDILDVQAVVHTSNEDSFNFGTDVTPKNCCPATSLRNPVLSVIDFQSGNIILPVIQNEKIRDISLDGDVLGCSAEAENQGGVILYWNLVDGADYYIVYRKEVDSEDPALPIIASARGNRNSLGEFPSLDDDFERNPVSILPNMWLDFPPIKNNTCCNLINFDPDKFFDSEVSAIVTEQIETRTGETLDPGAISESFVYTVVAYARDDNSSSDEQEGSIDCCNFEPLASDITLTVQQNTPTRASFDVYHPLAARPLGSSVESSGNSLPMWFFSQNSIGGDGKNGISNQGGRVNTQSKIPDRKDISGMNQPKFTYTPKTNFVGKDGFKYVATILNLSNRFRPSTWCRAVADVNVYVAPASPTLTARSGLYSNPAEREKSFLSWNNIRGATSYNLYRNSVLIDSINADPEKLDRYNYTDSSPNLPSCIGSDTSATNTYEISSVYLDPDGTEIEGNKNSASVVFVCPIILDTTATVVSLSQSGFNIPLGGNRLSTGSVNVSWTSVTNAESYTVFRKDLPGTDFKLVGRTDTLSFVDRIPSCNTGCGDTQDYEYRVVAISGLFESDPSSASSIIIPCYDQFVPEVSNTTVTIQERGTLSLSVSARAIQGTISTYTLVTPPASDEGTLTFNPDGTFTFVAALNFTGTTQFEWQAQDSCGNTSNALFTINVEAIPTNTNLEYVIGDANEVTSQQNTVQVRIRNRKTSQVPFMLNNKGASSLRKRCFAFSVTRGLDPFSWAPSSDGCTTPTVGDPTLDPGDTCVDPTIGTAIIGTSEIGECE